MGGKRVARIVVLHGPDLDKLGTREPEWYGRKTLEEIDEEIRSLVVALGYEAEIHQTNREEEMVRLLRDRGAGSAGVVLNAGAWTHSSVAVREAVASLDARVVEVHMSNVYAREPFRRQSMIEDLVVGKILGFGGESYLLAVRALDALAKKDEGK
ncbi:MAG: 3-dehydroquinate dehydratase [Candidatus Eisenbacteria bacterium]|nr:3-dehydroquinate dehydratase [Candidatus Eisenbacteria bacterium]